MATPGNVFLKLFDNSTGKEIPAHDSDLLRIEAHDFDTNLYFRVCGKVGTYFLISDRPGHISSALKITFYQIEDSSWNVNLHTAGVASHPYWDINQAIRALGYPEPIHPAIERLIREHVQYREGRDPIHEYLDQLRLYTLDADDARRELSLLSNCDPEVIIAVISQTQPVVLPVLCGAISIFCNLAELQGKEVAILLRLVPPGQHERLEMVVDSLDHQSADFDDELKRLLEET